MVIRQFQVGDYKAFLIALICVLLSKDLASPLCALTFSSTADSFLSILCFAAESLSENFQAGSKRIMLSISPLFFLQITGFDSMKKWRGCGTLGIRQILCRFVSSQLFQNSSHQSLIWVKFNFKVKHLAHLFIIYNQHIARLLGFIHK